MGTALPHINRLHRRDVRLLFVTRFVRMFAYGLLSVLLVLYLARLGLRETKIGLLLTLTLVGDIGVSLWLTTTADRFGRRRTLVVGAALMLLAGAVFALTNNFALLVLAAAIGVISPSGNEVGPFLSVEQPALSQVIAEQRRTYVFGWYSLIGSLATATGGLVSGAFTQALQNAGVPAVSSYRSVVWAYAGAGIVLGLLFLTLSKAVEITLREGAGGRRAVSATFWGCTAPGGWWRSSRPCSLWTPSPAGSSSRASWHTGSTFALAFSR
jgi:MFS family permease